MILTLFMSPQSTRNLVKQNPTQTSSRVEELPTVGGQRKELEELLG
jgi:hypothetical protein